jgi:hypothetical protein
MIVQLPRCYAPAGMLRDFDGGLRLPVSPLTSSGRKSLSALHRVCRRLLRKGAPAGVCKGSDDWAADTSVNPVRPGGEAALLKTQRANDCRLFESDGSALDDETGRGVLPGETVIPLVCVEHVWVRPGRRPAERPRFLGDPGTWPGQTGFDEHQGDRGVQGDQGARATRALSAGITLKLLQVIVVTERVALPRMVGEGAPDRDRFASPPRDGSGGGVCSLSGDRPSDPLPRTRATAAEAVPAGKVTERPREPRRSPIGPGPAAGGAWVPSENDIKSALSRLRKVVVPGAGARGGNRLSQSSR